MTTKLDTDPVYIPCQHCRFAIEKSFGWLKANTEIVCPKCGTEFEVDSRHMFDPPKRARRTSS